MRHDVSISKCSPCISNETLKKKQSFTTLGYLALLFNVCGGFPV